MVSHKRGEFRHVVEGILSGTIRRNRFDRPVAVGESIMFYSSRPLPDGSADVDQTPDDNAIAVTVLVSKVEPGPNQEPPYFVEWDEYAINTAWSPA